LRAAASGKVRVILWAAGRHSGEGGDPLHDLPTDPKMIQAGLLDAFDRQRRVDLAARLAARYFTLGHSSAAPIGSLAHAVMREDAGLEAGVRQVAAWGDGMRAGIFLSRLPAVWRLIHLPNVRGRKRLTSRGA
jgi:hypothetical protein